jgi:hypothetical protein
MIEILIETIETVIETHNSSQCDWDALKELKLKQLQKISFLIFPYPDVIDLDGGILRLR